MGEKKNSLSNHETKDGTIIVEDNKKSKLKKIAIKVLAYTLLILILIGVIWLVGNLLTFNYLKNLFDNTVAKIVNVSGINPFLVKGILIIVSIPFLWACIQLIVLKFSFFKKKKFSKRTALLIIVLYIGIFFLTLYFLSRDTYFNLDGTPKKWYAKTIEGIVFYDSPGVDPIYSIPLKPVTREIIELYKKQKLRIGPMRVTINSATEFFDPITGESKIWYYIDESGDYQFFNHSGYHPVSSNELLPVTKEIVSDYFKREKELKNQELLRLQSKMEAEKRARIEKEEAEKKKEMNQKRIEQENFVNLIKDIKVVDNKEIEYRWQKKIYKKNILVAYLNDRQNIAAKVIARLQRLGAFVNYEKITNELSDINRVNLFYSNNDLETALAIQASIIDIIEINMIPRSNFIEIKFEIF